MTDVPPSPALPAAPPKAPGNRITPGFVIAIAIAVLMLLGVLGLVAAALFGDDDSDPTGGGLRPTVNVDEPATAPQETADPGTEPTADRTEPPAAAVGPEGTAPADASPAPTSEQASSGDDFSEDGPPASRPTLTTAVAVNDIEQLEKGGLPEPGGEPVELPVQVTTPAPPSTYAATAFGDVGPGSIAELDGWSEADRSSDHVAFTHDGDVVDVFVLSGVATVDEALELFYDDVDPELEELTRSPIERLGVPSARFESVAGAEYSATVARQQRTSTMSGTIVAAVRSDGTAIVLTTSRAGSSSAAELTADGELLRAILARL